MNAAQNQTEELRVIQHPGITVRKIYMLLHSYRGRTAYDQAVYTDPTLEQELRDYAKSDAYRQLLSDPAALKAEYEAIPTSPLVFFPQDLPSSVSYYY